MHEAHLKMIARRVLCREGQISLSTLLKEGRMSEVKALLLEEVDHCFWNWFISFTEAAEFYSLLDLPPERFSRFPQRRNRAFF